MFQLLHQDTNFVPLEFIAVIGAGDALDPALHRQLLLNAFARGAALMQGKANADKARPIPATARPPRCR